MKTPEIPAVIAALGGPTAAAILIYGSARKQPRVGMWATRGQIPATDAVMRVIEAHTRYNRHQLRPDVYGRTCAHG